MDQHALRHYFHALLVYGLGQTLEKLVNQVCWHHKVVYVFGVAFHVLSLCGQLRLVLNLRFMVELVLLQGKTLAVSVVIKADILYFELE